MTGSIRHLRDEKRKGTSGKPFKRRFGEPKAQENFTGPDSRIMKRGSSGFEHCYNAQIAVDEKERVIVATGVTQSAADAEHLLPVLDEVEANTGEHPTRCLADAGYRSESNLQELEPADGASAYASAGAREHRCAPDRPTPSLTSAAKPGNPARCCLYGAGSSLRACR